MLFFLIHKFDVIRDFVKNNINLLNISCTCFFNINFILLEIYTYPVLIIILFSKLHNLIF
jgi:hypothetical protein